MCFSGRYTTFTCPENLRGTVVSMISFLLIPLSQVEEFVPETGLILNDNGIVFRRHNFCLVESIYQLPYMETSATKVSVRELKDLLISIELRHNPVYIRFRTIGHLWHPNFLRIVKIERDKPMLFLDETKGMVLSLSDITTIIQFELDRPLHPFEPFFHYQVSE